MTAPTPPELLDVWQQASNLAGLHVPRSLDDLHRELANRLVQALPGVTGALLMTGDVPQQGKVEIAFGADNPLALGSSVAFDAWPVPDDQRLQIRYRTHDLGWLLLGTAPGTEDRARLEALLDHYGVALANLTFNEETESAADRYCGSLQALEEGIVLFQEEDRDAVTARIIGLATSMMGAPAGALYVLEEVGNTDSDLVLTQALGMPEAMLEGFAMVDGSQWPRCLLDRPAFLVESSDDPTLGGLQTEGLPPILTNLVSLPLRYHGVVAGVCILFNAAPDAGTSRDLDPMNRMGELGAALLHRLSLEAISVRNRDIETQLEIAETIQKGLLPAQAPECKEFEFAWRSVAAQNIGGDYLDLLTGDAGEVHALIADASGHGINSALLMTSFRSAYRAEAPRRTPEALMGTLNDELRNEVGSTGMFITAATFRLDPKTGELVYSSAGHNPLFLYRAATGEIEELESHGPPLGFIPGIEYEVESRQLQKSDVLFLYTDGVTEATPEDSGEMYGEERLQAALREFSGRPADEILEGILERLNAFSGRERYEDDVSLSVIVAR